MDIRFAHADELHRWNERILSNPDGGNVFQGKEFAQQKMLGGWLPHYIIIDDIAITIHEKHVPGLGKLWYAPKGPGVMSPVQLGDLLPTLCKFAAKQNVFAIKVEPELQKTDDAVKALKALGFVSVAPIQPNASTVLVDLTPALDTIMADLNQKGRHAIRRAERDGVTVKRVETSERNCKIFYDLLAETAADSFAIRPYEYYRQFWQRYSSANQGQLFFAYFNDKVVAAAYAMVFGKKSTYKDGASVRDRTAYGASHLLQWHVMQWAKEMGSHLHDLCGSPPSDRINDESHPHHGVGRFKTSFNKHITDYVGAYDIVVKPRQYAIWSKYGERVAKSYRWRTHHENWY